MTLKSQIDRFSQNEENFNALITGSAGTTVDLGEAGIVKSVATVIGEIAPGVDRGSWATTTAYIINDIVLESGAYYRCRENHTSGTFATDLAAGKWRLNQGGDSTILTHRGRMLEDVITARFDTVAEMIADVNLVVGDVVEITQTGSTYKILSNAEYGSTPDEYLDYAVLSSTAVAKKLIRNTVRLSELGAVFGTDITTLMSVVYPKLGTSDYIQKLIIDADQAEVGYKLGGTYLNNTVGGFSVEGEHRWKSILQVTLAGSCLNVNGASAAAHVNSAHFSNFTVKAVGWTGLASGAAGIAINRADWCSVTDVNVIGETGLSWQQGIQGYDVNNLRVTTCYINKIRGNGISLDIINGTEDTFGNAVEECFINEVGDSGIGFHNNVKYSSASNNIILNAGQVGGAGIDIAACSYCEFSDNIVVSSGQIGIRLIQLYNYPCAKNKVTGNLILHRNLTNPAVQLNDVNEGNVVSDNSIYCADGSPVGTAIALNYTSNVTHTDPATLVASVKFKDTIIKNNTVNGFAIGCNLDGIVGISLGAVNVVIDDNDFNYCTKGLGFNPIVGEILFYVEGHNNYRHCTNNVSATSAGLVRNYDPVEKILNSGGGYITTSSTTPATVAYFVYDNKSRYGNNVKCEVSLYAYEIGTGDGVLSVLDVASAIKGSTTIGEFGYAWVSVAVTPNAGLGTYEIRIAKTVLGGEVATKGFNAKQVTYY